LDLKNFNELSGISLLIDLINSNINSLLKNKMADYLEIIVNNIQSLPDRDVVILQIARHIALSSPYQNLIINGNNQNTQQKNHYVFLDSFILTRIREWIGSMLNVFGSNSFNNVRIALENDVMAQVRPSMAAALIVNCVYGLDVTL